MIANEKQNMIPFKFVTISVIRVKSFPPFRIFRVVRG